MAGVTSMLNIVIFTILLIVMVFAFIQKNKVKKEKSAVDTNDGASHLKDVKKDISSQIEYVQDFLDFEKITSNMIVRENGSKFTMIVNCSGINYDLMSENEKMMVEEAFIDLLNFIRFPIQIYVQTRKVDLKDSLKTYDAKIIAIQNEIRLLYDNYNTMKAEPDTSVDQLAILEYEIERKQNLFEYAADLKKNIERMSMNKNVMQQKYYIILTYHIEELGLMNKFSEAEVERMAYAELFTRSQSIMSALGGCGIESRILDSNGLVELLYMAFNRDDAELYRLKDNMEAGFYRLYSTTKNALEAQQSMYNTEDEEDEWQLPEDLDFSQLDERFFMTEEEKTTVNV